MALKVGVTTGLYYIAHPEELATTLKKIGYGLTRGTSVIEISGDTPHEITETDGREIRALAEKQGIDLSFHGSLTIPMCIPERTEWRDAHDHILKSIRSAVNAGCVYVDFHSALHFWVELMTYTAQKLEVTMCDHMGRFVSYILYENKKLREWFLRKMWELGEGRYPGMIITHEEDAEVSARARVEVDRWAERERRERIRKEGLDKPPKTPEEEVEMARRIREIDREISREGGRMSSKIQREYMEDFIKKKLSDKDHKKRRWRIETFGRLTDAYRIVAHHLFYTKDPIWIAMTEMYRDLMKKYKLDYSDPNWLDNALDKAELENDRLFKEFYYAVVGSKFLEGHMRKMLEWLEGDYINKELEGRPDLQEIARNIQIGIENPDARDPKYAGLYLLYRSKQIYAAIKTLRRTLNTSRVWMIVDFEHIATQGLDSLTEMKELIKIAPDFGNYIISVHSNRPNPLHSHYPIELGDELLYKLLLYLRKMGLGKARTAYLIFERGGGQDPFIHAVDALKLMAKYLEKDVEVGNLPLEFYGLEKTAGDVVRQEQIMREHRFDLLKDLFEIPEEEWGMLSAAATQKGKKEIFKKEELR